jgi:glycerate dehydrogenase
MGKLKKLAVLDRIILLDEQWSQLRAMTEEFVEYAGLTREEIVKRLEQEADQSEAPMCWTQLAQEEMTAKEVGERIKGADGVITCWTNIPDSVLLENMQLRYLGFWTNLVEHRVNLDLAKQLGITVDYIPDYGTDSVAEMTLAGMLAVSRELLVTAQETRRGSWAYELLKTGKRVPTIDQIPQRMLKGKRLGLVGFGRIGQRVAELAQAFGMTVSYWSQKPRDEWRFRGVLYSSMEEIFAGSDIISVHLSPYAPARIISARLLSLIRDGGIFVNTSAGRLVDQEALWRELQTGRITAYMDVYETLPPRRIIGHLMGRNVFTYRAAWFTQEAVAYKGDALVSKLRAFLESESAQVAGPIHVREGLTEQNCSHIGALVGTRCSG